MKYKNHFIGIVIGVLSIMFISSALVEAMKKAKITLNFIN